MTVPTNTETKYRDGSVQILYTSNYIPTSFLLTEKLHALPTYLVA